MVESLTKLLGLDAPTILTILLMLSAAGNQFDYPEKIICTAYEKQNLVRHGETARYSERKDTLFENLSIF